MNVKLLEPEIQVFITSHLNDDVNKLALAKSPFPDILASELAGQILAKKKSILKLPTWFQTRGIYYPPVLSIEQCSSEITAAYKATLAIGETLIDLTSGFGVDSLYFSKYLKKVISCEINTSLAEISAHNAKILNATSVEVKAINGIEFLESTKLNFDTIYIDPARRLQSAKVFKLKDCTPDVTVHLPLFLKKSKRVIIKTSPILDITAGLKELKNVSAIHIVSIKNECKELLWIVDKDFIGIPTIVCTSLNEQRKTLSFTLDKLKIESPTTNEIDFPYLYEPDVALLKSGAFNFIGTNYQITKLHPQSQLYFSQQFNSDFIGRIFKINQILQLKDIKKDNTLVGNVIVRNFPEKAEVLVKKFKIKSSNHEFIIFTQNNDGYIVIKATILQHY